MLPLSTFDPRPLPRLRLIGLSGLKAEPLAQWRGRGKSGYHGRRRPISTDETDMIPRVRIDEAEAVRKWARSTGHPFFEENLPILEDLFLSSLAQGATPSLALQFNLLRFLLSIEAARRRYRRYKERFGKALRGLTENGASLDRVKRAQSLMNDAEQGEPSARALEHD